MNADNSIFFKHDDTTSTTEFGKGFYRRDAENAENFFGGLNSNSEGGFTAETQRTQRTLRINSLGLGARGTPRQPRSRAAPLLDSIFIMCSNIREVGGTGTCDFSLRQASRKRGGEDAHSNPFINKCLSLKEGAGLMGREDKNFSRGEWHSPISRGVWHTPLNEPGWRAVFSASPARRDRGVRHPPKFNSYRTLSIKVIATDISIRILAGS